MNEAQVLWTADTLFTRKQALSERRRLRRSQIVSPGLQHTAVAADRCLQPSRPRRPAAAFDTDAELDWSASKGVEAGVYRGIDAVMGWLMGYLDTFDTVVIEPERFIESDDSVVVPNVAVFRGRDGIEATARSAFVYEIRGSRINRFCLYQNTQQALKAVGLEE